MKPPVIAFSPTEPLVIRPLRPQGFTVETRDGVVVFACPEPYERATFTLQPLPEYDRAVLTVDLISTPIARYSR